MSDLSDLNFDASVEPEITSNFAPVPAGEYEMIATTSERKASKSTPGNSYLAITFEIISGGEHSGRLIFENYAMWCANPDIARGQFAMVCRACGLAKVGSSEELHNIPFIGRLSVKKETYLGEEQLKNRLKSARPKESVVKKASKSPAAASNGAPASAQPVPWNR